VSIIHPANHLNRLTRPTHPIPCGEFPLQPRCASPAHNAAHSGKVERRTQ
jgi:hypothetical protein